MKQVYKTLLENINNGVAVLTAVEIHKDIPTIHTITGKYHDSVRHCGFGVFSGRTENGEFTFFGGGSMYREPIKDGYDFAWCPLQAEKNVIADLGYNFEKAKIALETLIG